MDNRAAVRILSGDIGATNSRIALFESRSNELILLHQKTYSSQAHASLTEILAAFRQEFGVLPELACFGIPGPIKDETAITTNLPWRVHARELKQNLGLKQVWLLNDLESIAHGIFYLKSEDFISVVAGAEKPVGNAAVIAPGSGLGEAGIYWDGRAYRPFGSEGGHCAFSPSDPIHIDLLQYLLKKFQRVSWERLLSGPGLINIFSFFRDAKGERVPDSIAESYESPRLAQMITSGALDNGHPICLKTVALFYELLAFEAANLALKMMATGGVFIGGGIVPQILSLLDRDKFQHDFTRQGRLSKVLETIPLKIIHNGDAGMIGAAHFGLGQTHPFNHRVSHGTGPEGHHAASRS